MKFDYIIGNPPYQENQDSTSDKPVYHLFMDAAISYASAVELITPARFLYNAGKTPKEWNNKMLNDEHFSVLKYIENCNEVFPNTDIKGGIAITYYDKEKNNEPIKKFISNKVLRSILYKVIKSKNFSSISDMVFSPESYKFTKIMYEEHPELKHITYIYKGKEKPVISKGHDFDLTTNIFDKLDGIIFMKKPNGDCVKIFGRKNNARCERWIKRSYLAPHSNLMKYKMLFPKSNGSGKFGEIMSQPIIAGPNTGHTQTFISVGCLDTNEEANNEVKYIKTKFARTMLGILKVTQDNKKSVWKYVPLQDFTSKSDIDWSKSIDIIDQQLYKKYRLSDEEITFIESHVKEMD